MRARVLGLGSDRPCVADTAFIAPGATVVGDVVVGPSSSVWYGAVVRADVAPVRIGRETNIQDGAVIHVAGDRPQGTLIGDRVTIGHLALVHACTIEDDCLVGMKACVMDGAYVERGAWIAAGALVTPGKRVRTAELWAGSPAKFLRALGPGDLEAIQASAAGYVRNALRHAAAREVVRL